MNSLPGPVKRSSYESPLRAAQARATRRAIVAAAARLFVEHGYGATTVDAIAEAAGVSRKTVFTSVGGKSQALKLALDWAAVGDDEPVPLMERPQVKQSQEEPDARRILTIYATMNREIGERASALHAVLTSATGVEDDLRALAEEFAAQRRTGMGALAGVLDARGSLRPGLSVDEAADVLWMMSNPANYRWFVTLQGWAPERYEQWLGEALVSLLLDPDYRPRGASTRG